MLLSISTSMQSSQTLPRVYIIAQRAKTLEMVSDELRSEPMELVPVRDEKQYFETLDVIHAGCVLVDIAANQLQELTIISSLKAKQKDVQIIAFSDQWQIDTAVRAIKLGASEVCEFPKSGSKLQSAILKVLNEEAQQSLPLYRSIPKSILLQLTSDEIAILQLIVQGQTAKEVGSALDVSVRTFHYRKKAIFSKLGVPNRSELIELIRLAIEKESQEEASKH